MFARLTLNSSALQTKLRTIPQFMDDTGLPESGEVAIFHIKEMTAQGLLEDGTPMQQYSPAYYKLKKKLVGSATPPNLRLTGEMIESLQYFKGGKNHGEVNVSAENYKLAQYNTATRPFLQKGTAMIANIKDKVTASLKAFLR